MTTQPPFCRFCGKPIPKKMVSHYFNTRAQSEGLHPEKPRTVEEATALLDGVQILQHRWGRSNAGTYIAVAYTWDGKNYTDPYFCRPKCAENLGRLMAEQAHCTSDYNNAVRRHRLKGERNA